MVAGVANYNSDQTSIHRHTHTFTEQSLDVWTHTCYQPNGVPRSTSDCAVHRDAETQTPSEAFPSICLRKVLYLSEPEHGLPLLLLLYVFPSEAIAAQNSTLARTFSCSFIAYGQRDGFLKSSTHRPHQ